MHYSQLVNAFITETGLDADAIASTESFTVQFDGDLEVTLESAADGRHLHMHAVLAHAACVDASLYATLLELHLFGIVTNGAYFGLNRSTGCILLFKTVELESATTADASAEIAAFVDEGVRWRDGLPAMVAEHGCAAPLVSPNRSLSEVHHVVR